MFGHKLEIERNVIGMGWDGYCECSDPDYVEGGWEGQTVFHGDTEEEVRTYHFEHTRGEVMN